jgi:D-alanyl-D-alanine carboxypeptidase
LHFSAPSAPFRILLLAVIACTATNLTAARARAEALLLIEADSGKVLHAENATMPWYPASITKIMTVYLTLRAVKEGRITLDKLIPVSPNAVAQQPVKMGFPTGTMLTVDNALKMLLVKSANDMAVVLAEGVAGSIENFADQMNQTARRLGMTQSNFVNPNGLPADEQIVSARDMAILARAAIREFPEYDYYWHLPGIRLGKRVVRNYNTLLGRYAGADGMKTGFICASGFNLVATATRNGKRLIAVVLGAPSGSVRAVKAAQLLESGFQTTPLSWLTPSLGTVDALQPVNADPPNLRDEMCGKHRKRPAAENEDASFANLPADSPYAVFLSSLRMANGKGAPLLQDAQLGEPVVVFTGPKPPPESQLTTTSSKPAKPSRKPAAKPAVAATIPTTVKPASLVAGSSASGNTPKPRVRSKGTAAKTPATPARKAAPKATTPQATAKSTAAAAPKTAQKGVPKAAQKTSHAAAKPKAAEKQ